jgi:hypothetical protein
MRQEAETRFEFKVPTNVELAGNLKGNLLLVHARPHGQQRAPGAGTFTLTGFNVSRREDQSANGRDDHCATICAGGTLRP